MSNTKVILGITINCQHELDLELIRRDYPNGLPEDPKEQEAIARWEALPIEEMKKRIDRTHKWIRKSFPFLLDMSGFHRRMEKRKI